jgi:zinc transporter ZupT
MAAAVLLTGLALVGVAAGVLLHRGVSNYFALAGGLLLFAIAFVWVIPEISEAWGWPRALLSIAVVVALLAPIDWALTRLGHSPRHHGIVIPLLAATAIHSLLDGWSIRVLASHPLPPGLVPIGLGLHKIPEGFALGWVLRRALPSHARALSLGALAEMFTILGAVIQPVTDRFGVTHFGINWTPTVLCIIAGAFLFLGGHALLPYFTRHEH